MKGALLLNVSPFLTKILTTQDLEDRFNDPNIPWKTVIVTFIVSEYLFEEVYLEEIDLICSIFAIASIKFFTRQKFRKRWAGSYRKKTTIKVKSTLEQKYSCRTLKLIMQARFGFVHRAWNHAINLIILYYDIMPYLWELMGTWQATYFRPNFQGEVSSCASLR